MIAKIETRERCAPPKWQPMRQRSSPTFSLGRGAPRLSRPRRGLCGLTRDEGAEAALHQSLRLQARVPPQDRAHHTVPWGERQQGDKASSFKKKRRK